MAELGPGQLDAQANFTGPCMPSDRSYALHEYARIVRERNLLKLRLLSVDRRLASASGAWKSFLEERRLSIIEAMLSLDEEGEAYLLLMRKDDAV
ncbi:hypothetical protein FHX15_006355 [Rhizobium sp. BK650]|nr:hypothetical protein [Rhizobium sp. BK650]